MRAFCHAALFPLALSFVAAAQQTAPSVPEPETLNVFYRLNSGTLVSLERQTTTGVQLKHGFMSAKVAGVTEVPGGQSPVRFHTGPLDFVVAMGGDPAVYSLRKLEIKKNKRGDTRELLIVTAQGAVFHATKADTAEGLIPLDFSRYGTSSYKAVPTQPLSPGEYAFWRADSQTVFCFGVD